MTRLDRRVNPPADKPVRVRLKPAAESIVRRGHPWVFAESVRDQNRTGATGDLAVIYDRHDKFLAAGLLDNESPLRIRIAHLGRPTAIDTSFWHGRLADSRARRDGLFGRNTTGYRLVNGESDGLPGLVLDRYDDTLVLKLYTAAWLPHLATIQDALAESFPSSPIILRPARNLQAIAQERTGLQDGQALPNFHLPPPSRVEFLENGIRFLASVRDGQKTGFFLDQRDNRARVEKLAPSRHVLNCFSFTGGFSMYAARGGAASVTDVDISEHALREAREHRSLNGFDTPHHTEQANVFHWLRDRGESFDLIIIDPPSLAKKSADRDAALKAYRQLFAAGIQRLRRGGVLVAASCSAHVRKETFFELVTDVAVRSHRRLHELERSIHAPDHPTTFPEAEYLKAVFLEARD